MKKTGLNYLLIAVFAIATAFTSCYNPYGYNNGNENGNPVSDPEGTITVSMRNRSFYNGDSWTRVIPDGCNMAFIIDGDDNFYTLFSSYGYNEGFYEFTTIGKISGLGNIKSIPTSGWSKKTSVTPEYGYIARCIDLVAVDTTYLRIYVVEYITAANSNGIIGAKIKYQSPFIP